MKYDVWLCDDGTMDTVIGYTCPDCGADHEFRYDCEFAAGWRRPDGSLRERSFFRDVVIPDIDSDECPFVDSIGDAFEPAWNGRGLDGAP